MHLRDTPIFWEVVHDLGLRPRAAYIPQVPVIEPKQQPVKATAKRLPAKRSRKAISK